MEYLSTINIIQENIDSLIEEMIFFQQTQTSILRNEHYLIKDKDTQAVFESILLPNQAKIAPNNHQKEYDLKHNGNKISIKSGSISNNNLTISYSRTSSFQNLDDKIKYLASFENLIVGIATEKLKSDNENVVSKFKYYIYYFPANLINFKSLVWEENPNSYFAKDEEKEISVDIKKKLSDQPWITIPLKQINHISSITCQVVNFNKRKYLTIEVDNTKEKLYYELNSHRSKMKSIKGLSKCTESTKKALMD